MPNTWRSHILLNLVLVAKADGEIKPIEVLYLSRCKNKRDANHHTLADAIMRSYWEDVGSVGGLLGDEETLKDMINMAMIDGTTDPHEQGLIIRFIDAARIPATRVETLMREAMARMQDEVRAVSAENDVRLGRIGNLDSLRP